MKIRRWESTCTFLNESKPPQRIDELETMESQLAIFAEASEEEQQSMLAAILKQGDKIKDLIKRTQAAYVAGDPDALQKVMDEQDDVGSKSLEKKLLDDRNVAMTAKMEEYLKGKEPDLCGRRRGAHHRRQRHRQTTARQRLQS